MTSFLFPHTATPQTCLPVHGLTQILSILSCSLELSCPEVSGQPPPFWTSPSPSPYLLPLPGSPDLPDVGDHTLGSTGLCTPISNTHSLIKHLAAPGTASPMSHRKAPPPPNPSLILDVTSLACCKITTNTKLPCALSPFPHPNEPYFPSLAGQVTSMYRSPTWAFSEPRYQATTGPSKSPSLHRPKLRPPFLTSRALFFLLQL